MTPREVIKPDDITKTCFSVFFASTSPCADGIVSTEGGRIPEAAGHLAQVSDRMVMMLLFHSNKQMCRLLVLLMYWESPSPVVQRSGVPVDTHVQDSRRHFLAWKGGVSVAEGGAESSTCRRDLGRWSPSEKHHRWW